MTRGESGQALIETIMLGLLLLVPLVWLLGVLADVQRAALATTAAAREAGFEASHALDEKEALPSMDAAIAQALSNHALDPGRAEVEWHGSLDRGERIEIEISYPIAVTQAPLLGEIGGPSLWIRARHAVRVDPYGSRE